MFRSVWRRFSMIFLTPAPSGSKPLFYAKPKAGRKRRIFGQTPEARGNASSSGAQNGCNLCDGLRVSCSLAHVPDQTHACAASPSSSPCCLLRCAPVRRAAEIRLAVPAAFADDPFVKSLLASTILAARGVTVAPSRWPARRGDGGAEKGEADLAVFALDEREPPRPESVERRDDAADPAVHVQIRRGSLPDAGFLPRRARRPPTPAAPACSR